MGRVYSVGIVGIQNLDCRNPIGSSKWNKVIVKKPKTLSEKLAKTDKSTN